ncbi:potassium channel family protein [Vulcanisaeta sp. JCM 14467]|uniref:potassium channel family protein n=1 Tax=Vulcanisaeta sp. JCM 14467 TaxID=1295370 RepID=UPI0006D2121F|nr:TrkA family potassium uptake protein [Vulcanisaeta sp. JCM 14467]
MRLAIIIGANNVGINVAKTLMDRYDVVIVDSNDEACSRAFKTLKSSALVYRGDPTSEDVLNEVGIDKAELFLALSDNDELNYRACSIARGKGVPLIIARVNNRDNVDLFRELNVNAIIVEDLVSNNVSTLIMGSNVRSQFTDPSTNLKFAIVRVNTDSQLIGKSINDVIDNYGVSIPYVITSNGITKSSNDHVIESNDELVIVGPSEDVDKLISELGG